MPYNATRLPKMTLPKFKGQYSEFQSFMSLFESLVHNNPSISNIEKFNHLISCLSGEALGTVKVFHQTEENYPKALASLKKVYDNKCLIYFDTVSKLIDLPPISKPSSHSLRTLIDTVSAIFDSLLSLGNEKNIANGIIISLVMAKVDAETRSKWEEQLDYNTLPMWSECEAALNKRFQYLSEEESFSASSKSHTLKDNHVASKNQKSKSAFLVGNSKQPTCSFCNVVGHFISSCQPFKEKPVEERFVYAKSNSMCINCLQKGHSVSNCKSSRCKICNRPHNTLLHRYTLEQQPANPQAMHAHTVNQTILATAVVQVQTSSGDFIIARALLDSGSQVNFMTEDLAQKLRISRNKTHLKVTGIGNANTTVKTKLETRIKSRINDYQFVETFWVLPCIAAVHPDNNINTSNWDLPKNITLADPNFAVSKGRFTFGCRYILRFVVCWTNQNKCITSYFTKNAPWLGSFRKI